ncbi:hypothetical protein SDJN03_17397, partial [Cucurbita argyrosperma subsp. sororia]
MNHSDSTPVDGKKQREPPPPAPNNSSSNLDSKGLNNSSSGSSHNVSEGPQEIGILYQELQMELPESSSAVKVETAEGWDQGWDDD